MADKKTVGELKPLVEELVDLFSDYFIITKRYVGDRLKCVNVNEALESTEFVKYDYELIYKKIDDVVNKIKGIDSGRESFVLSEKETNKIIGNVAMTFLKRD